MNTKLKQYFPMLRTREEILREIERNVNLTEEFYSWREERREDFLDFCTGVKGVYTIVLIDKSQGEFHKFKDVYRHFFEQKSDTGLKLNLLQNYIFIPLDIFRKSMDNKGISNKLDAWLAFLSMDSPEVIMELFSKYPEFKTMYEHVYDICQNVEKVMGMYSEELKILDQNTVRYMVDQMQEELETKDRQLETKDRQLETKDRQLEIKDKKLEQKEKEIQKLRRMLAEKNT